MSNDSPRATAQKRAKGNRIDPGQKPNQSFGLAIEEVDLSARWIIRQSGQLRERDELVSRDGLRTCPSVVIAGTLVTRSRHPRDIFGKAFVQERGSGR